MSAAVWHNRRFARRFRNFAVAIIDRETAETPDELRLAERCVRRASHLLDLAGSRQRSRD